MIESPETLLVPMIRPLLSRKVVEPDEEVEAVPEIRPEPSR